MKGAGLAEAAEGVRRQLGAGLWLMICQGFCSVFRLPLGGEGVRAGLAMRRHDCVATGVPSNLPALSFSSWDYDTDFDGDACKGLSTAVDAW